MTEIRGTGLGNTILAGARGSSDELAGAVQTGETTLTEVAKRLRVDLNALVQSNPQILDPNKLKPGQDIYLPKGREVVGENVAEFDREPSSQADVGAPMPGLGDPMTKSLAQLRFNHGGAPGAAGVHKAGSKRVADATDPDANRAEMKNRIDNYFDHSNTEYTLPDGSKVRTLPHFRMNSGNDGATYQELLTKVIKPKDAAMKQAIHMVAFGRGTPAQIKMVTQALIDKGGVALEKKTWQDKGQTEFEATYPNTPWPLTDADAVKLLQRELGVGVDCAGYVQQEFLSVHGGSRADYGFQSIGNEDLSGLKTNKHFRQVGATNAEVGDLMILDPPAKNDVGHTVMIQDRHVMAKGEEAKYPGMDKFAKAGDKVHVFVVEGSFGAGPSGDPSRGGVQRRTFFFNETTGKWADMRRDWTKKSPFTVNISSTNGPYDHPLNGVYRAKGK